MENSQQYIRGYTDIFYSVATQATQPPIEPLLSKPQMIIALVLVLIFRSAGRKINTSQRTMIICGLENKGKMAHFISGWSCGWQGKDAGLLVGFASEFIQLLLLFCRAMKQQIGSYLRVNSEHIIVTKVFCYN